MPTESENTTTYLPVNSLRFDGLIEDWAKRLAAITGHRIGWNITNNPIIPIRTLIQFVVVHQSCSMPSEYEILNNYKIVAPLIEKREEIKQAVNEQLQEQVHHPQHYGGKDDVYETIKVAQSKLSREEFIGAMRFQIMKYNDRCQKKNAFAKDIAKLAWYSNYLKDFIERNPGA